MGRFSSTPSRVFARKEGDEVNKSRLGFIGTGIMGRPMASNLLRAGYDLTVFNRTPEKARELIELGARLAGSPREVAEVAEVVITIVTDAPAVREVVTGPEGALLGLKQNDVLIDMSTIDPATERELKESLGEKGAHLLDAPVSGGDVGAREGTLAIMVGGEEEVFRRVQPILQVMGATITFCGEVGLGQLAKLCNQVLVSVNLLAVCEALALARKNGLDPAVMLKATMGGAAGSWQLSNLGPRIVEQDFDPGFMVDLMQKDLDIVLRTAFSSSSCLPATALVHHLFNSLQANSGGSYGTQALALVLDRLNGGSQ